MIHEQKHLEQMNEEGTFPKSDVSGPIEIVSPNAIFEKPPPNFLLPNFTYQEKITVKALTNIPFSRKN